MQSKENKTIDTRKFTEIWDSLGKEERGDLSYAILLEKIAKTRQTVWNWGTGRTVPTALPVRKAVAGVVRKFGIPCDVKYLF